MKYFDEGDGLIKLVISSRNAENDVNYTFINLRLRRNSIYDYFRFFLNILILIHLLYLNITIQLKIYIFPPSLISKHLGNHSFTRRKPLEIFNREKISRLPKRYFLNQRYRNKLKPHKHSFIIIIIL